MDKNLHFDVKSWKLLTPHATLGTIEDHSSI